jgi:hypothetical protein
VDELECDVDEGKGRLRLRLLCHHNGATDCSQLEGESDKQDNHVITQNLQIAKG